MKYKKRNKFTLVELLVYMAVFSVFSTIAYKTFTVGHHNSQNIIRITDDILRISHIGDIWRKEFKKADNVEVKNNTMIISYKDNTTIIYSHKNNQLLKSKNEKANRILASNIKSIEFKKLDTLNIKAYEMNIELHTTSNEISKICPLFSFIGTRGNKNE